MNVAVEANSGISDPGEDLSAVAWVAGELQRSLDTAHKALRRFQKETQAAATSDVDAPDAAILRQARVQFHQSVGALELVGLPLPAKVLRASEAAVQRVSAKPSLLDAAAVETLEGASFAVIDFLNRMLGHRPVSAVALFPQYREVQTLAGVERIHPADLWEAHWRWQPLAAERGVTPRNADNTAREEMESLVLSAMRSGGADGAALMRRLSDFCAQLAAGANTPTGTTSWQLAAAFFEAQAAGLLDADVYTKRMASRLLGQLRAQVKTGDEGSELLASDLLFFCSRARPAAQATPRLAAIRRAWELVDEAQPVDYTSPRLGRYDPAWLAQARKRVVAAKDVWSAVAGGDTRRLGTLGEPFALLGDSLHRLFPGGDVLSAALQAAASQTAASGERPGTGLAMEMATAVLWIDAALEEAALDTPELAERVHHVARRIDQAREGGDVQPLEPWIEELYRRVSDQQTMGSVVHELRASLTEIEKAVDQFFRNPLQRDVLVPVPGQLQAMRGVLSLLDLQQASAAVVHMRNQIDELAATEIDPALALQAGTFDRLADNLGSLGFLIDMLSVQPHLARSLFQFNADEGRLIADTGGAPQPSGFGGLGPPSAVTLQPPEPMPVPAPAPAPAPADPHAPFAFEPTIAFQSPAAARQAASTPAAPPAAAPVVPTPPAGPAAAVPSTGLEDDDEMRGIFLEEAREVIENARSALQALAANAEDIGEMTTVRRAFHTLKGSSRMVGLREFGEAAWGCEQLYNARLASDPRVDLGLAEFTRQAFDELEAWVGDIEAKSDAERSSKALAARADALRLGRPVALALDAPLPVPAPAPSPEAARQAEPQAAPQIAPMLPGVEGLVTMPGAAPAVPLPEPAPIASAPAHDDEPESQTVFEALVDPLDGVPDLVIEPSPMPDAVEPVAAISAHDDEALPDLPAFEEPTTLAVEATQVLFDTPEPPTMILPRMPAEPRLQDVVPDLPSAADLDLGTGESAADPGFDELPPTQLMTRPADSLPEVVEVIDVGGELEHVPLPEVTEALGEAPLPELTLDLSAIDAPDAPHVPAPANASPDRPADAPLPFERTEVFRGLPDDAAAPDEQPPIPLVESTLVLDRELTEDPPVATEPAMLSLDSPGAVSGDDSGHAPTLLLLPEALEGATTPDQAPIPDLSDPTPAPGDVAAVPHPVDDELAGVASDHARDPAPNQLADPEPGHEGGMVGGPADEPQPLESIVPSDSALLPTPDLTLDFATPAAPEAPAAHPPASHEVEPVASFSANDALADGASDEGVKVIGPLRISIPLFNIFLNEADEQSRRLVTELAEWALEWRSHPAPESCEALTHSLAGNSATVGYADLSALARALEHAIGRCRQNPRGRDGESELFSDAAEEIRRLLHQFAAGFLKPVPAALLARLAEHEHWPALDLGAEAGIDDLPLDLPHPSLGVAAPAEAEPASDIVAPAALPKATAAAGADDLDAVDEIDADLLPIFIEEAEELLPQLQQHVGAWMAQPGHRAAADAAMRNLHTFKGGARLAGAMRVGELAHRLETEIEQLLSSETVHADQLEPLQGELDRIAAVFEALRAPPAPTAPAPSVAPAPAAEPSLPVAPVEALTESPVPSGFPTDAGDTSMLPLADLPDEAPPATPQDAMLAAVVGAAAAAAALTQSEQAAATPAANVAQLADVDEIAETTAAPLDEAMSAQPSVPTATTPADGVEPFGTVEPVAAAPAAQASAPEPEPLVPIDWSRFGATSALLAAGPGAAQPAPLAAAGVVRVRSGLLDRLVNGSGEVSIARARIEADVRQLQGSLGELSGSLDRMRRELRDIELQAETQISARIEAAKATSQAFDPLEMDRFTRLQELTRMMAESVNDVATLQRSLQRSLQSSEDQLAAQARITRELQEDLLRTRMTEFESLADRLYRVVRQASRDAGKQVKLEIVGGSIEVDRGVLDRMAGPFEHLLRNSVAHGIESADDRAAAGKDRSGSIRIDVAQAGNEVVVEFTDDGAGLNLARIRERAVERGLLAADAQASDDELARLIFLPGFSTAGAVTELAGRGVGMDVVRSEVNAMGGRIETHTQAGQGTRFRLVLPLTTAVTQIVMLRCGSTHVAVPSTLVEIVRRVPTAEVDAAYGSHHLAHAGESVPFYWLAALVNGDKPGELSGRTQAVIVIRSASQRVALHVDEVEGNQEVVVKNLGPQLARMPGLAGVTLLPSGDIALIYNPVALAALHGEQALLRQRREVVAAKAAMPDGGLGATVAATDATSSLPPLVMVVDDSLTVRRVTQRLLEREGYRVVLAKDGIEALERLDHERPKVMLCDIEMPRMDGFELVRTMRADPQRQSIPVVMITSRIAQKHRDHAATLGVEHYLGKPFAEDALLGLVAQYCAAQAVALA